MYTILNIFRGMNASSKHIGQEHGDSIATVTKIKQSAFCENATVSAVHAAVPVAFCIHYLLSELINIHYSRMSRLHQILPFINQPSKYSFLPLGFEQQISFRRNILKILAKQRKHARSKSSPVIGYIGIM
jgi:hypothetical protein